MQINIAHELNYADSEENPTYPLFTKFLLEKQFECENDCSHL